MILSTRGVVELPVAANDHPVPYGEQPDPQVRGLVRAAALASEIYGDDELERWADEARRASTESGGIPTQRKETNDVEER